MRSVLTLTPNPALDISGEVLRVIPNEKNYVLSEQRHPGGNAINVARVLTRLKIPVTASGFVGGAAGLEILKLLEDQRVRTQFVSIHGDTRINVTVQNQSTHDQTRLSFPGPTISSLEKSDLFHLLENTDASIWVAGGSFPDGFNVSDMRRWIRIANQKQVPFVLDVPGKYLKSLKNERLSFIKPNYSEWKDALGIQKKISLDELIQKSRQFFPKTDWICVSSFDGGAVLIGRREAYFGRTPKIKVQSSVGAGDSMVAGWVFGMSKDSLPVDSFRKSLACAAATLITRGTQLAQPSDIERLFKKCMVKILISPKTEKVTKKVGKR